MSYDIFLSWSGEGAAVIASALKKFLKLVLGAKPFFSGEDIPKGSWWGPHLFEKWKEAKYGLIVLTPSNLKGA